MKKPNNLTKYFEQECKFVMGAYQFEQIQDSKLTEIAFIGRSNVGKSSLINAILERKMALTSKTPGRTRQLNFFTLGHHLSFVDMPGYGYAKVSKNEVSAWEKLSYRYFATRSNLKRVFILVDSRRGITPKDEEMMNTFDALAVSYQMILTKIDELKKGELEKIIKTTQEKCKKFPALHPEILSTSSNKNIGILDIKKTIIDLL